MILCSLSSGYCFFCEVTLFHPTFTYNYLFPCCSCSIRKFICEVLYVQTLISVPILKLCGPVKSWKRFQASDGTPKGFGFCEFESAEGVLRVLRLLSKFNIDGQELVV